MNGEQNVLMTLDYTATSAWQRYNYIQFTMPKNNLIYDTGANSGKAVSLITSTNKGAAQITIDGSAVTISNSWV
jgi:hypothetical protein